MPPALHLDDALPRDLAGGCARSDPHRSGRELLVAQKAHRHGAGEAVSLGTGVVFDEPQELLVERRAEGAETLVVGGAQPHLEGVGRENAVAADDSGLLVELAAQG